MKCEALGLRIRHKERKPRTLCSRGKAGVLTNEWAARSVRGPMDTPAFRFKDD